MIIYTVHYDIENMGNGILGIYSSEEESIQAILKEYYNKNTKETKEELYKKIKKEYSYEWDKGRCNIESSYVNLNLYIAIYEDFSNGYSNIIGIMKSEEGIIDLIINDIKNNKEIEIKGIKEKLNIFKEYSRSHWNYKIVSDKIINEQQIYSCKEFYILKDYEDNKLRAYENNGIFIYSEKTNLENFKEIVKNILYKQN